MPPTPVAHSLAEVTPIRKPSAPEAKPLPATARRSEGSRLTRPERKALARIYWGLLTKKREAKRSSAPVVEPIPRERTIPRSDDPWLKILRALEPNIPRHTFETWLKPTRYVSARDRVLYVEVPTADFSHGGEKFADMIAGAIEELGLPFNDVKFVTPAEGIPAPVTLTEQEARECVAQACELLSTKARQVALEDAIVALRIEGMW